MAREFNRTDRVADFLRRELAVLIQQEMRDPRVELVSITEVEVSKDLGHARVYYTAIGRDSEEQAEEVTEALNKASGFLRSQLSKDSSLRTVPQLKFRFDSSVGRGRYMEELIDKAVATDEHEDSGDAS